MSLIDLHRGQQIDLGGLHVAQPTNDCSSTCPHVDSHVAAGTPSEILTWIRMGRSALFQQGVSCHARGNIMACLLGDVLGDALKFLYAVEALAGMGGGGPAGSCPLNSITDRFGGLSEERVGADSLIAPPRVNIRSGECQPLRRTHGAKPVPPQSRHRRNSSVSPSRMRQLPRGRVLNGPVPMVRCFLVFVLGMWLLRGRVGV